MDAANVFQSNAAKLRALHDAARDALRQAAVRITERLCRADGTNGQRPMTKEPSRIFI